MEKSAIRLLLIEDNADDVLLVRNYLAHSKSNPELFDLESAPSLRDGLSRLAQGGIDLILLDLNLPDSQGLATFQKVSAQTPGQPIMILSALEDEAVALEAVRSGAQDYLPKTRLDPDLLTRSILYAVERNEIRRKLAETRQALAEANASLERVNILDPLTELLNRRGMQEALSREIHRRNRDESDLLALLVNLDDFKKINDTLGHAVGDVVLKEVSAKLKGSLRVTDYVAHIGSDRFVILLPQTKPAEGLLVAEKVRLAIANSTFSQSGQAPLRLTASLGLVNVSSDVSSVDELFQKTHPLPSLNYKSGKNRVAYPAGRGTENRILSDIRDLLQQGSRFRAVKQAIFHLPDLRKIGYEFLSRSSIQGFEMPDDFFRACLEANILTIVDHHCLKICISASASLPIGGRYHVNLFPSTIIDIPVEHLLEEFAAFREQGRYCVELSEQQIIGDPSYLTRAVESFRHSGVLIAIDDVGFGRSCLESLIILEPDIVKIDKKCVKEISQDRVRIQSLKRLLKVIEAIGAEVVAEGIESEEDFALVRDLGVKYGQGFFLERPS